MPNLGMLWIDGVGSFSLWDHDELTIGQSGPDSKADLTIRGNLSRLAATIRKVGEDHFLFPAAACVYRDQEIREPFLLRPLDKFTLGGVVLQYHRSTPLSTTSKLTLLGPQSWQPFSDGAILMGGTCSIGPRSTDSIRCADWDWSLLLYRQGEQWWVRPPKEKNLRINGEKVSASFPLVAGQRIIAEDVSLFLEKNQGS